MAHAWKYFVPEHFVEVLSVIRHHLFFFHFARKLFSDFQAGLWSDALYKMRIGTFNCHAIRCRNMNVVRCFIFPFEWCMCMFHPWLTTYLIKGRKSGPGVSSLDGCCVFFFFFVPHRFLICETSCGHHYIWCALYSRHLELGDYGTLCTFNIVAYLSLCSVLMCHVRLTFCFMYVGSHKHLPHVFIGSVAVLIRIAVSMCWCHRFSCGDDFKPLWMQRISNAPVCVCAALAPP